MLSYLNITNAIRAWFLQHKRELPWRKNRTPYAVWVSEIMLQQTQVNVVIPYFEKWMERWPTLQHLAKASEEEVVAVWEGLGYYSRARSLLNGAKVIVSQFNGEIPSERKLLESIPGIGHYTAGALLSFAFHQKAEALDGNVIRVLTRLFGIADPVDQSASIKQLRSLLFDLLECEKSWEVMEGFIEFGALVCKKKPLCTACPIQSVCMAHSIGKELEYPKKHRRIETTYMENCLCCILYEDRVLITQNQKRLMKGLWQFPLFEQMSYKELERKLFTELNIKADYIGCLASIEHGFTRFRVKLFPSVWVVDEPVVIKGYDWVSIEEMQKLPFPAGHRTIKERLVHNRQTFYDSASIEYLR